MTFLNVALTGVLIWSGIGGAITTNPYAILPKETTPEKIISVKLTGYNATPEQTDEDPSITASGVYSNPEVVAARSRDLSEDMPFGTVIELSAPSEKTKSCGYGAVEHLIGYRVIADTMHSRKTKQIDILFDQDKSVSVGGKEINPAVATGICEVFVRVVGKIDVKDTPKTQAELSKIIKKGLLAVK